MAHTLNDYARHVQAEIAKDPTLAHPNFRWCLMQVERHLAYVCAGGPLTKEQTMEKLVLVIKPLARKKG
jgi:hypothetical protein